MTPWLQEIEELHDVFQAYFVGSIDSLARVEDALGTDFTIVNPGGVESNRSETLQALRGAHQRMSDMQIWISEPKLLIETAQLVVASYIENQQVGDETTHRLSTVVFNRDGDAPLGLSWHRVHETWVQGR